MPPACGVNLCLSYRVCGGMIQSTLWCHVTDVELHREMKLHESNRLVTGTRGSRIHRRRWGG